MVGWIGSAALECFDRTHTWKQEKDAADVCSQPCIALDSESYPVKSMFASNGRKLRHQEVDEVDRDMAGSD